MPTRPEPSGWERRVAPALTDEFPRRAPRAPQGGEEEARLNEDSPVLEKSSTVPRNEALLWNEEPNGEPPVREPPPDTRPALQNEDEPEPARVLSSEERRALEED